MYKFNNYTPTYVNPGSVAIAETLRQRYGQALLAQDTLTDKVDNMHALEKDKEQMGQMQDQYREKIQSFVDQGDYENMGMDILRSSRQFLSDYKDIDKNYQARQSEAAKLQDRIGKSEDQNGITTQMYYDMMADMDNRYQGAASGDTYGGKNYAKFVNVNERMDKRLKGIASDAIGGLKIQYADLTPTQVNEMAEMAGVGAILPGATYSYTTESGETKLLTEDQIDYVVRGVLNEGDVKEYLQQDAYFRVGKMNDRQKAQLITDELAQLQVSRDAIEGTTPEDNELREAYARRIQDLQSAAQKGTVDSISRDIAMSRASDPFRDGMKAKYGFVQEANRSEIVKRMSDMNDDAANNSTSPIVQRPGALQTQQSPGGMNRGDKLATLTGYQQQIDGLEQSGIENLGGIKPSQLVTMTAEQAEELGLDPTLFRLEQNNIRNLQGQIAAERTVIAEAMRATGETDKAREEAIMASPNMAQAVTMLRESFSGLENDSEAISLLQRYVDHVHAQNSQFSGSMAIGGIAVPGLTRDWGRARTTLPAEMAQKIGQVFGGKGYFDGPFDNASGAFGTVNGSDMMDITRPIKDIVAASNAKIDEYINTVATRTMSNPVVSALPGATPKQETEIVNFLKGKQLNTLSQQFIDPQTGKFEQADVVAGSRIERGETEEGFKVENASVTDVEFGPYSSGVGGATLVLTAEDEDGRKVVMETPLSQMSSPIFDQYTAGAPYQFLTQANAQHGAGVENIMVPIQAQDGTMFVIEVDYGDKASDHKYNILMPDGSYKYTNSQGKQLPRSLETALKEGGEIYQIGQKGGTVLPRGIEISPTFREQVPRY